MFPLSLFLKKLIKHGTLNIIDIKGKTHSFIGTDEPNITIHFHDNSLLWEIFLRPDLKAGEAYMNGRLTITAPYNIFDFLNLITKNMEWRIDNPFHLMGGDPYSRFKGWVGQINWPGKSKQNVAHHYDLSDDLYDLFLDKNRQYSTGYFLSENDTLEQAQLNKMNLISKKLLLKPHHIFLILVAAGAGLDFI